MPSCHQSLRSCCAALRCALPALTSSLSLSRSNTSLYISSGGSDSANGTDYYFIGANYWQGASLGSSGPGGNRSRLIADLDALRDAGVTQLRVLGASEGPDSEPWRIVPSLQPCPGVYNLDVLDGFDFLIAEMGKRYMKATVTLGDEWAWSGGFAQLVKVCSRRCNAASPAAHCLSLQWAEANTTGLPPDSTSCDPMNGHTPDITSAAWRSRGFESIPYPGPGQNSWSDYQEFSGRFLSSPAAQALWQAHASFMLTHVNAHTGIALRDDPTVMAWQLANEPRAADGSSGAAFISWLNSSSSFLKKTAPKQLVCSGMGAHGVCIHSCAHS